MLRIKRGSGKINTELMVIQIPILTISFLNLSLPLFCNMRIMLWGNDGDDDSNW